MAKRLTRAQILGEQGVALVMRRFLDMGFPWHPTNAPLDAGVDGFIEIRDPTTGEVSNSWLAVQSKARSNLAKETDASFEFACSAKDLTYWRCGNMPVLLIVSRPERNEAWWVEIKRYFRDPAHAKSKTIRFEKKRDRLDESAAGRLLEVAQSAGAGTYFRPAPKPESLFSNLLYVGRMPAQIYRAETEHRERLEALEALRNEMDYPPREWFLADGAVYSVHNLRESPWTSICDLGTVETIESVEWSESEDPQMRRHFTWLLGDCLREVMGSRGLRHHPREEMYYFKASKDLKPWRVKYKSQRKKTSREVFGPHPSKKDPSKVAYYRHVACGTRFRRIEGRWYLEINPTYLYTSDGRELHPFREEYLAGMKKIEGSGAVGGLVIMFGAILADRSGLFDKNSPHLGFDGLLRVDLRVGIDDALWSQRTGEVEASAGVDDDDHDEPDASVSLFDEVGT